MLRYCSRNKKLLFGRIKRTANYNFSGSAHLFIFKSIVKLTSNEDDFNICSGSQTEF